MKLTYFDGPGRAEVIRLTLAAGGVAFEDKRFASGEEFAAMKPSLPFGQVPILEVDGEVFSQSQGILRLAGRLSGLYPEDAKAAARVDMVTESCVDVANGFAKILFGPLEGDEKKAALVEHGKKVLPGFFAAIEARIAANGSDSGFIVGDAITIADVAVFNLLDSMNKRSDGLGAVPESFAGLAKLVATVAANEGIVAYKAK